MRSILRNSEISNLLDSKGVASIPFSEPTFIDSLKECFDQIHPVWNETMNTGYYFSIYGDGSDYRKQIFEVFYPILKNQLDDIFSDYKVLAIIAQVKGVGANSSVNIHQDLTVVDESKYKSYTLWIPLQDSTEKNGAISFLEGSHKVFRSIRAHTIDYLFGNAESNIYENSKQYQIAKGEALIFDAATIHFSGPNISEKPRISIAVSIVAKEAETQIFHYDRFKPFDGSLDRYTVPENFWQLYEDFSTERSAPPLFGTHKGVAHGAQVLPYAKHDFIRLYDKEL